MTNREMLLECLAEDDWETNRFATSYIECPYVRDSDCKNKYEYGTVDFQIFCDENCKTDWLQKEFKG